MIDDVVKGEYHCPRCGGMLKEKRPTDDKFLVRNKDKTIRLKCPCGYYEDRVVDDEDFLS
jgi:uncharacterized C2H2 Zn-finger protein